MRSLGDRISSLTESATRRENLATTVVVGTLVTASTAILARRWWTKPRDGALSEYQAPFAEPIVVKTRSGEEVTVRRVAATSAATAKAGATLGSALKKDPLVVACAKKVRRKERTRAPRAPRPGRPVGGVPGVEARS